MAETQFTNIMEHITKYQNEPVIIKDTLSEENIMSMIFSKEFEDNDYMANYLLSNKSGLPIQNFIKYYDREMAIINVNHNQITANDKKVVDFDLSPIASQTAIKYLFLLDLLSEMYSAYDKTKGKSDILTLKCRYYIDENTWSIFPQPNVFYVVELQFSKENGMYNINDIIVNGQVERNKAKMFMNTRTMFEAFSKDINKHIQYLQKNDIQQSIGKNEYLYNIQTFYKFCRLKFNFYILRCIRTEESKRYIDQHLIYLFLNLKNDIIMKNPSYKNIFATNKLLLNKKKLQNINDETTHMFDVLKKNSIKTNQLKGSFNKQYLYVCTTITVIFILTVILLMNMGLSDSYVRQLSMIIILITILVYITMYYILYINNTQTEYFEGNNLDKIFQFPVTAATANDYRDEYVIKPLGSNPQIKIYGSSISSSTNTFWKAFDKTDGTFWQSTTNKYSDRVANTTINGINYKAEYIAINLGQPIFLKYFTYKAPELQSAPENIRIYGNDNMSVATLDTSSWKPLLDIKNIKYGNLIQRRFNVTQTMFDEYQYPQIIAGGNDYSIVVTNDNGIAYSFGLNNKGQLGINSTLKQFLATEVRNSANAIMMNIVQVSAGGFHTLFLTSDGKAFACGENKYGQLGQPLSTLTSSVPLQVQISSSDKLKDIIQVCAGHMHSMFLKSNKTVVGCGRNKRGQLGVNSTTDKSYADTLVLMEDGVTNRTLTNVIQISAGVYSFATYFLRSNGSVFRCGRLLTDDKIVATNIPISYVTLKIASAGGYCMGITDENQVWGVGKNEFNQLGNTSYSATVKNVDTPQILKTGTSGSILTNIVDIAAGTKHSLFLQKQSNNTTRVYASGFNQYGQFGIGRTNANANYPTLVTTFNTSNVAQIAAGGNHSIFATTDNRLFSCGFNGDGQLGAFEKNATYNIYDTDACISCLQTTDPNFANYVKSSPQRVKYLYDKVQTNLTHSFNIDKMNQTRTLLDNCDTIIYTSNIQKLYSQYALAINKLALKDNTISTTVKLSEWNLFGNYPDQTSLIQGSYTAKYNAEIQTSNNLKALYEERQKLVTSNLNKAIEEENRVYNQWKILADELAAIDKSRILIPPNMSIEFFLADQQKYLEQLGDKIKVKEAVILAYTAIRNSSNTDIWYYEQQKKQIDDKKTILDSNMQDLSRAFASINSIHDVLAQAKDALDLKTLQNNGLLSEEDALTLAQENEKNFQAARLATAQLEAADKQYNISLRDTQITDKSIDLANIRLQSEKYWTKLQNEIANRESIQTQLSAYNSIDAELNSQEIQRLKKKANNDELKARLAGVEEEARVQSAVADEIRTISNELTATLNTKIGNMKQLETQSKQLANEIEEIDRQLVNIESDTTSYVNSIERDTIKLQARRNREKKRLELKIVDMQRSLAQVQNDVKSKIEQYDAQISADSSRITELMTSIRVKRDEIVAIVIERQKYKYVPLAVSVDSSIVNIQAKILYNINSTATVIANSIILTGMDKELNQLENQKPTVKNLEVQSQNDMEIQRRDDKLIYATNKLLINILLSSVLIIVFYNSYNMSTVFLMILIIVAFAVLITVYYIEILHVVRTFGNQYYW